MSIIVKTWRFQQTNIRECYHTWKKEGELE